MKAIILKLLAIITAIIGGLAYAFTRGKKSAQQDQIKAQVKETKGTVSDLTGLIQRQRDRAKTEQAKDRMGARNQLDCEAKEGAIVYANPVVTNTDGSVYCKIDIGIPTAGQHTYQVVAKGDRVGVTDSASVPLTWNFGAVSAPAGLRVTP